jgi:hypothetical protein
MDLLFFGWRNQKDTLLNYYRRITRNKEKADFNKIEILEQKLEEEN